MAGPRVRTVGLISPTPSPQRRGAVFVGRHVVRAPPAPGAYRLALRPHLPRAAEGDVAMTLAVKVA